MMNQTISLADLFGAIRENFIGSGFKPSIRQGNTKSEGLTIHDSLRSALNMKSEDSIYMYWNWEELVGFLHEAWRRLDAAASDIAGRKTSTIAYLFEDGRSVDDALAVLDRVDCDNSMHVVMPLRRPTTPGEGARIPLANTLIGAIVRTMSMVVRSHEVSFGDVLSQCASVDTGDVDLLRRVDSSLGGGIESRAGLPPGENVLMMRALVRAFQGAVSSESDESSRYQSFSGFLVHFEQEANWSGLSDQSLLRRLLNIAPETAQSEMKRIEIALGAR